MSANLCKGVNSSHTPGPWIVSHDPDAYSDDDYCIGVPDGKVDQVAVCSKQDAALISAAPDMYEALLAFLHFAENNGEVMFAHFGMDAIDRMNEASAKARAALTKAAPK